MTSEANSNVEEKGVSRRGLFKRVAAYTLAASLATGGVLVVDNGLDGENDILQALGLEAKPEGVREFTSTPKTVGKVPESVVVTGEGINPDVPAASSGAPTAEDPSADTSRISQGGGLGPVGDFNWGEMRPLEVAIPEANLSLPIANAPVVPTGYGDQVAMQVPNSYYAGWLMTSAPLTAEKGTTTLAGHVNFSNGNWAPMSNLYNAKEGMTVRTTDADGTVTTWVVDGPGRTVAQNELTNYFKVEDLEGERVLVLITCHSAMNSAGQLVFTENFVITAKPVG